MKKHLKRITWQVIGSVCLILGVVGIFLPILQGLIFILFGLFVLSMTSDWFRSGWHRVRDNFPKFREKIKKVEDKIESKIGHWFRD